MEFTDGLTAEQLQELEDWGNACEQAQESWAERQNEAVLARTDDFPPRIMPRRPSWLSAHETQFHAKAERFNMENDEPCPF